jgi:uncharacterized protein (DUF305 family)
MKINYKITTIILSTVLLITYAFHWDTIFFHNKTTDTKIEMNSMHRMPDGSMVMNNGNSMTDMTMTDMVAMMKGKTGKTLEKEFITGMIPHHQGAVDMAKLLLQDKTVSRELQKFATDIIIAQESEIKMMNEWLKSY